MKVNVLLVSMFSLFLNIRLYSKVVQMKYLNVAEKNDAAKTISGLLSKGASRRVSVSGSACIQNNHVLCFTERRSITIQ